MFWRPTGFYWRRAIRTAGKEGLRHITTGLVSEIEFHRAHQRESQGGNHPIPPLTITAPNPSAMVEMALRVGIVTLREIALSLVTELEAHRREIARSGWIPGKDNVHPDEKREKGWSDGVDPFTEIGPDGMTRTRIEELY